MKSAEFRAMVVKLERLTASHEELLAALRALTSAVNTHPDHKPGIPAWYFGEVGQAQLAIKNAEDV